MTYDLYSSIFIRYYILSIIFVIALLLSIVHGKKREFSIFFLMSSFVLCDTLSGYLERPNNSDSNISHCCHRKACVYSCCTGLQFMCRVDGNHFKCAKYSDNWLWSQLKIIHSYCFSITY